MVEMNRPMRMVEVGENTIPIEIVEAKLQGFIYRRRMEGCEVEIIKPIYYEGLNHIRCILLINGFRVRIWYHTAIKNWRHA
jgi:hypothetical protein